MKGILKAMAFGYLLGLLTAPKKGKELRAELKEYIDTVKEAGAEALSVVQDHGQQFVEKVSPAIEQLKVEGGNLKAEGQDIGKNAKDMLDESLQRSKEALNESQQRIAEKAAPAVALVKEDATALKNGSQEILNNASNALTEAKTKAIETFKGQSGEDKVTKSA